jgi:L-fuconolactonase
MLTIDAQVHAYERDHPGRPWAAVLPGPPEVVSVDGALLVSPWTLYRYDATYAIDVHAAHPGRFGLIKPVDPTDAAVVDTITDWADTNGAVGIRIMLNGGVSADAADPGINRVLAAAARHSLPVNLLCWGRLKQARLLAARNPGTMLVIDHLGLQQPFESPVPAQPFSDSPKLLDLAAHDNIVVKVTGACTLSHQPFPYNDLWGPLCRIFDAFGFNRCMWRTDWTRAVAFFTHEHGVDAFRVTGRMSASDRAALMG